MLSWMMTIGYWFPLMTLDDGVLKRHQKCIITAPVSSATCWCILQIFIITSYLSFSIYHLWYKLCEADIADTFWYIYICVCVCVHVYIVVIHQMQVGLCKPTLEMLFRLLCNKEAKWHDLWVYLGTYYQHKFDNLFNCNFNSYSKCFNILRNISWPSWRVISPETRMFVQDLSQVNNIQITKFRQYRPFVRAMHWWPFAALFHFMTDFSRRQAGSKISLR